MRQIGLSVNQWVRGFVGCSLRVNVWQWIFGFIVVVNTIIGQKLRFEMESGGLSINWESLRLSRVWWILWTCCSWSSFWHFIVIHAIVIHDTQSIQTLNLSWMHFPSPYYHFSNSICYYFPSPDCPTSSPDSHTPAYYLPWFLPQLNPICLSSGICLDPGLGTRIFT